jgi:hypothetical protein
MMMQEGMTRKQCADDFAAAVGEGTYHERWLGVVASVTPDGMLSVRRTSCNFINADMQLVIDKLQAELNALLGKEELTPLPVAAGFGVVGSEHSEDDAGQ